MFYPSTANVGTFGYKAHYIAGGGPTYGNSFSACFDLTVTPACSGVSISADQATGDGAPAAGETYTWTVRMRVHACDAATGLKAQGGGNGWATTSVTSWDGSLSTKTNKKNQVYTWTFDSLAAGAHSDLVVTITGTIKPNTPSGTILTLTGPWSVVYSTDGGVTYQKSEYAGSVTVTVL
ncbi:MAG: hypothetical protein HYX72_06255 [Acidobacteria bacterium]|nr:hypothetical protein [Acidobacteriota bacterium]